jgi:hypothetical protein
MMTELHEVFKFDKHFFEIVCRYDYVVNKWENSFATWPLFERFLELALAEVRRIHETEGYAFISVDLWGRQVVARHYEGYFVSVFLLYLKLVEPGTEIKSAVERFATKAIERFLNGWNCVGRWYCVVISFHKINAQAVFPWGIRAPGHDNRVNACWPGDASFYRTLSYEFLYLPPYFLEHNRVDASWQRYVEF